MDRVIHGIERRIVRGGFQATDSRILFAEGRVQAWPTRRAESPMPRKMRQALSSPGSDPGLNVKPISFPSIVKR